MLLSLFTPRKITSAAGIRRPVDSFAHDGLDLTRGHYSDDSGRAGLVLRMILAFVAFAYVFRLAIVLDRGVVGFGQVLTPLAEQGAWGAALADALMPDRVTMAIAELLAGIV